MSILYPIICTSDKLQSSNENMKQLNEFDGKTTSNTHPRKKMTTVWTIATLDVMKIGWVTIYAFDHMMNFEHIIHHWNDHPTPIQLAVVMFELINCILSRH